MKLNKHICGLIAFSIIVVGYGKSRFVWAQASDNSVIVEQALDVMERNASNHQARKNIKIDELEVKNEDIHEVLELISKKGRLNIITGPNVKGKVSIFLKNIEARDALRVILDANELAFSEDNGIIRVLTAEEFQERYGYAFTQKMQTKMVPLLHANSEEMHEVLNQMKSESGRIIYNDKTKTFVLIDTPDQLTSMETYIKKMDVPVDEQTIELKYIEPKDAMESVQQLLTENKGSAKIDAEKKTITIIDTQTKIQEIKEAITKLDQAEKKVTFDVNIVQIILNDEHTKGVDWEAIVSDYQNLEFLGLKNAIEGKNGVISLGTVTEEDLIVLKEALDTVGDISSLNDFHKVSAKEETVTISVNGLDAVNLSSQKSNQETKDQEEDMRLYVKPVSYEEDKVNIYIKPEVFSLAEKPTDIAVKDGSTIVIGSLFKKVTVQTERKIPIISDIPLIRDVPFHEIPLLGFAFRNQKKSVRKTELIIFITSKIVTEE